jgi:hypothetical protein
VLPSVAPRLAIEVSSAADKYQYKCCVNFPVKHFGCSHPVKGAGHWCGKDAGGFEDVMSLVAGIAGNVLNSNDYQLHLR